MSEIIDKNQVIAELSAPNLAYKHVHHSTHVSIDDNKATDLVIDSWRQACAEFVCADYGDDSVIIDGVKYGPTPRPKARWHFVTSRPYVIVSTWHTDTSHSGGPFGTERKKKYTVEVNIGYQVAEFQRDGKKAVWREYPEVQAEQRSQLHAAMNEARGEVYKRRQPTVTYPDGWPRSADA